KIMAAAEEVSRITGEIDSSRTRLQRAEDNATELQSRLQAAEREAESAQAALEGAAEVDEVVDTSDRDALSAEVSQSSEDLVEARISHKSATDRARFLTDQVESLLRAAKARRVGRALLPRDRPLGLLAGRLLGLRRPQQGLVLVGEEPCPEE